MNKVEKKSATNSKEIIKKTPASTEKEVLVPIVPDDYVPVIPDDKKYPGNI